MKKNLKFIILVCLYLSFHLFFIKIAFAQDQDIFKQQSDPLAIYENKWRQVVYDLKNSLDKIIKENQLYRSQMDSLDRSKNELEEIVEQIRQENQKLRDELDFFLSDKGNRKLQKKISDINQKNKSLQKQIRVLNKEKKSLEQKILFSNRQIQGLDSEILRLKQEEGSLDSAKNESMSMLESDLASSSNTIKQLEKLLKDSEQEKLNYYKKIKDLEKDLKDIQLNNLELQKENAYLSQRYIEQGRVDKRPAVLKPPELKQDSLDEKDRQINKLNNDLARLEKEKAILNSLLDLYSKKLIPEDKQITKASKSIPITTDIEALDYESLGYVFALKGKYQQALEHYLLALRENPKNKNILYNLGYTYAKLNNFKKAISYYKQALKINPKDKEIYYNLYVIYNNLGDKAKTQYYYKHYLKFK